MGASCQKQRQVLPPLTDSSFQDNLVREQTNEFNDIYEIVERLGNGGISTIWKIRKKDSALGGSSQRHFVKRQQKRRRAGGYCCTKSKVRHVDPELTSSLRGPDTFYALKEIDVDKVSGKHELLLMRNEVNVLKSLDHPSIVRLFETFALHKRLALVMELCKGGDLASRFPYTERQAVVIIRQVLSAVGYMHNRKQVHRDIKVENILFQSDDPDDWSVKLIDFGLSAKYATLVPVRSKAVGTVYSMSPEALDGVFSAKVDLWSIGVVTYLLISGDRPFRGKTPQEMASNIVKQHVAFDSQVWQHRSDECKDFISTLLQKDPELRPSAEVALQHPWLVMHAEQSSTTEEVLRSVREGLIRYSEKNGDFKRLALNVMAKRLSSDELRNVREAFLQIDEDNNGYITMDELKKVLRSNNDEKDFSDEDIESIFNKLVSIVTVITFYSFGMWANVAGLFVRKDVNHNGIITWTEFVAGTLEGQSGMEEHRLADAFDLIDTDDSGYISKENLRSILGRHYSEEYVAELMGEVHMYKDKISFAEFKRVFHVRQPYSIEFHDTDVFDMLRWD